MYQKSGNSSNTGVQQENLFLKCHAKETVEIFKGKFAIDILARILCGNLHYGTLLKDIPEINPRILSQRLRDFENNGILNREVLPTNPPQVEYTLTDKGLALKPIFDSFNHWYSEFNS